MQSIGAALCIFALYGAGIAGAADAELPMASVNGIVIPQSTFDQALQQALQKGATESVQLKQLIRDQLIARELFLQEAKKQDLQNDPQVVAAVEDAKRNAMVQRYLKGAIQPAPVTPEQLREEYDRIKASLGPNEYKLRAMQLATEARASDFLSQLKDGRDFADLAQKESLSPSGQRGGELDWVSFKTPPSEGQTGGLPLAIATAVAKMNKGKVSEPIAVKNLWWLVKLEDVRPTRVPTFEETQAALRSRLANKALERATMELVQKLLKQATITQ
ncbi:MAG: peptidylprolyl isomerase [Betaproteobacteria bacterium]